MGRRCRVAALGATFALFVVACAVTESPRSTRAATRVADKATRAVSTIPETLASADVFVPEARCLVEHSATISVIDSATGTSRFTIPLAHDAEGATIEGRTAFVSLGWAQTGSPALIAVDLDGRVELWHRDLDEVAASVTATSHGLIVVGRDGVRSVDPNSGEDQWVTSTEFDFADIRVTPDVAYAVDTVALHAIDLADGSVKWQLPIHRADELAVSDGYLAVASGSRVIAVDTELQGILWEQTVNRAGAGRLHIGSSSVVADLSPAAAPVGGVVALDRTTGFERWRLESIEDAIWVAPDVFITSRVPDASAPGIPYEIIAVDATSGVSQWSMPSTEPASAAIAGSSPERIVISDVHPALVSIERLRAVDVLDGSVQWEMSSPGPIDGALVDLGVLVTLYRSGDPSSMALVSGTISSWEAEVPTIALPPALTPVGIVVLTNAKTEPCIGRQIGEPTGA